MSGGIDNSNINLASQNAAANISNKVVLNWEAPSFQKNERTMKWYLGAGLLIAALIGYSAWQRDWFIIIITIIVSAVSFWYLHTIHPTNIKYRITPIGIYLDERFYPFSEMHSFWMVYNESVKNIYIAFRKKYLPTLTINVENVDPIILKGYLLKKLPEQEGRSESLVDKLTRLLGL
jgi:hypothetical protein